MLGPVGGRPEAGHDFEREVSRREQLFGCGLGSEGSPRGLAPPTGIGDRIDYH